MLNDFKAVFFNDYIKVGNKRIRPFSIAWWIIKMGQVMCGIGGMYLLYCNLWLFMS